MRKRLAIALALTALVVLAAPTLAYAKTATRLTASLDTQWEHADTYCVLTGVLKTSTGAALKYQTVHLYYNGSKVSSKKTNSAGKVVFNLSLPGDDIAGMWQLRYAGTSAYGPSTSPTKLTQAHVHFQAEGLVPMSSDLDGDGVADYWVLQRIKLEGNSEYSVWTSLPTVRSVTPKGDNTELYKSSSSEKSGTFDVAADGLYDILLECPNDQPVDVFIW